MSRRLSRFNEQVRRTCQIAGAGWAVGLQRTGNGWEQLFSTGIATEQVVAVFSFLCEQAVRVLEGTPSPVYSGDHIATLGYSRVYIYPALPTPGETAGPAVEDEYETALLLIGADQLSAEAEGFFQVLAEDLLALQEDYLEIILDDIFQTGQGAVYGIPETLPEDADLIARFCAHMGFQGILEDCLAELGAAQAGYLALHAGDHYRVVARAGDLPQMIGEEVAYREHGDGFLTLPVISRRRLVGFFGFQVPPGVEVGAEHLEKTAQKARLMARGIEMNMARTHAARYMDQLALLDQLAFAASTGSKPAQVVSQVILSLRRTFHTDAAAIYLLSADGSQLKESNVSSGQTARLIPVASSLEGYVAENGRSLRISEIDQAPRPVSDRANLQAVLCAPLKSHGKVIGVISVESKTRAAFTHNDEKLLSIIASHLAGIIEHERQLQHVQAYVAHLEAIRETALDITSNLDQATLLKRLVTRATEMTHSRAAVICLVNPDSGVMEIRAHNNPWGMAVDQTYTPTESGIMGQVIKTGKSLLVSDLSVWSGRAPVPAGMDRAAIICVPLKIVDQAIGCLVLIDDRDERTYTANDLRLMELLAPQAAITIQNARLYQELHERIEAQHRAEASLIRAARLAAVGEMAAGVAHEINNPLASVTGFLELALRDLPADLPQIGDLKTGLKEARRARAVVRRLLDFARLSEGILAPADMNEVVGETLELVEHTAEYSGIEVTRDLNASLPPITIDREQIKQVLVNLVQNAVAAMPTGGRLSIKTRRLKEGKQEGIAVWVSDTGEGIGKNNLERIFEPFFTTRPPGSGTGLGLSVSYAIVSHHGGRIDVESTPLTGSTFRVWLPLTLENRHD